MIRPKPLLQHEAIAIACRSCGTKGEITTGGGPVQPSLGFYFDDMKVPRCSACDTPAGLCLAELDHARVA